MHIYTSEAFLSQQADLLTAFWQQGYFGQFVGKDKVNIHFCQFYAEHHQRSVIIVPGRVESYLKYKELAYEFFQQQFNVFIIDHRGQGLSQRLLKQPFKGYVDSFEDYVDDLHYFISEQVLTNSQTAPYLLAHSMGGAISCRYLQRYPEVIQAAVLSSPMIAINSGKVARPLAVKVVQYYHAINRWFSDTEWYFLGQGDYKARAFEQNPLMQSALRYQQFIDLYQQVPAIQLGGVTNQWLLAAENVRKDIFAQLAQIQTPVSVLQASGDTIVDNGAQDAFCQQLHQYNRLSCPNGQPTVINGARHEILFEKDIYRQQALIDILTWFERFPIH